MEAPTAPISTTRITDPLESPASGVRACMTEPDDVSSRGPTLPFVAPCPAIREPRENGPEPPDLPPDAPPRSLSSAGARRVLVRAFGFGMACAVLFLIVTLAIVVALWPVPAAPLFIAPAALATSLVVVAPSSKQAPEPSAAPAVTSPAAGPAASDSSAARAALLPPPRAAMKAPAPPATVPRPRAPLPRSEVVDPWGAGR
jgi:hypothetical protein